MSDSGSDDEAKDEGYLLGFASEQAQRDTTEYATKLGGPPVYPPEVGNEPVLACKVCGGPLSLVLQAYAPAGTDLKAVQHIERALFIFGCNRATCCSQKHAWRAFRLGWKPRRPENNAREPLDITATALHSNGNTNRSEVVNEGDTDSDGFSDPDDDMELLLQMHALKVSEQSDRNSQKSKRVKSGRNESAMYPAERASQSSAYELREVPLQVDPEPGAVQSSWMKREVEKLYRQYKNTAESTGHFPEDTPRNAEGDEDEIEQRQYSDAFDDRISRAPKQCVRYKFKGRPLTKMKCETYEPQSVLPCSRCGGARTFEMQILGSSLFYLRCDEKKADSDEGGMTWSSVSLYVCSKDCWNELSEGHSFEFADEEVFIEADDW